ncbi:MAG: low molecular weight protein-tyrosine-phosphatase [Streptosporangiaceae bacterium]
MASSSASELPPPREPGTSYRVCLVCLGNICRSPMAEAVLRTELGRAGLGDAVEVDSAGTGDWHVGSRMDARARAELADRGFDGTQHRARQFQPAWLARRDLVLAMDASNLADLRRMGAEPGRLRMLRSFDPASGHDAEVPDPYYGEDASFALALDQIEAAARGLTATLRAALA